MSLGSHPSTSVLGLGQEGSTQDHNKAKQSSLFERLGADGLRPRMASAQKKGNADHLRVKAAEEVAHQSWSSQVVLEGRHSVL